MTRKLLQNSHLLGKIQKTAFTIIALLAVQLVPIQANADENEWLYGDTLFGKLKYERDFKHYEHVNPDAPKGGDLKRVAFGGFDSFNPFTVRGRTPVGLTYFGGNLYETLFDQSLDQASASYGGVAEAFRKADDHSWAVYRINPKARWHDGKPITPEDVIWSMITLRKIYPLWKEYFKNVESIEETGDMEVTFKFDQTGNRELPHIIGDLVVLPKHWWTDKDSEGNQRDITQPTTEPPLGSGPYKIGDFDLGKHITWERVEDYWGSDMPINKGRYNYDTIRYTYFLDQNSMWEAFKKGKIADYRGESLENRWINEYNFPAVLSGDVEKLELPISRPRVFEGLFFNTRIEKFSNPKVRQALTLLFDFETLNKNLFFGLYERIDSFFERGELESTELPTGRELEILQSYKESLPDDLFTKSFELPDYSQRANKRKYQRQALKLLKQAGFKLNADRKFLTPNGELFEIEIITGNPQVEREVNSYVDALNALGISASLRILDTAQYKNRIDNYEFDMASILVNGQSLSPGNEQREYWSSFSAKQPGSRNYAGISDPIIDDLVERIILAPNRSELVELTRALDRILKWRYYAIPKWYNPKIWFAKWRHINVPLPQPLYVGLDPFSFWIDEEAEKQLKN